VVDRGGLENRCARKRTVGSNPTLSASPVSKLVHPRPRTSNNVWKLLNFVSAAGFARPSLFVPIHVFC
jgi:hypothetical protein